MTIRPLLPADAEELATLYRGNRDFLASNEPVRPPDFFTAEGQRQRIGERAADGFHQFAILDGDAIAGSINLFHIIREALQSGTIGYWVDHRRNGRGLATGAVGEVLLYAFSELGLHRIEAATLVDNLPSQRVLAKNGFEQIGLARQFLRIDDEWRDFLLFQRLVDD
ncbi:MAG TPA: GNAT family protein [Gaiellaceae bacterium]|nr:GNAT family protein [Gaiellaceae bacterium]